MPLTKPSRQTPALVAMGVSVTLGFWLFGGPAQPLAAVPASVTVEYEAAPDIFVAEQPNQDSLLVRGMATTLSRDTDPRQPLPAATPATPGAPAAAATEQAPAAGAAVTPQAVIAVNGVIMPVNAPITSPFGYRIHPIFRVAKLHTGIDFGAACGTPIAAALPGTVSFAGWTSGYGARVVIDHGTVAGRQVSTTYNHMSVIGVHVGQQIAAGQGVGRVGSTGFSTGCHLHFELLINNGFADPMPLVRDGLVSTATVMQAANVSPVNEPNAPASSSVTTSGTASAPTAPTSSAPVVSTTAPAPAPTPTPAPTSPATSKPTTASPTPSPSPTTSSASASPKPTASTSG